MADLPIPSALALLLATATAGTQPPLHVPPVHGKTLSGAAVELPEALHARTGVLVLGFSQAARAEVAAWARRLAADYRDSPTVTYYEMPVLAGAPRLLRGWVLGKVAEDVPDRAKPRVLPVLDHEADWKTLAGYERDDSAYILLVNEQGEVLGRLQGPVTDALAAQLRVKLNAIRQVRPAP